MITLALADDVRVATLLDLGPTVDGAVLDRWQGEPPACHDPVTGPAALRRAAAAHLGSLARGRIEVPAEVERHVVTKPPRPPIVRPAPIIVGAEPVEPAQPRVVTPPVVVTPPKVRDSDRAASLMAQGDAARAAKEWTKAHRLYDEAAGIWLAQARVHLDRSAWSAALPPLETACKDLPKTSVKSAAEACAALGKLLDTGQGVPADPARAAKLFKEACSGGSGWVIQNPDRSPAACLEYAADLEVSCAQGTANDCNNLGVLYSSGQGVPEDKVRAVSLFERCCSLGGNWAGLGCSNAASRYRRGEDGITRNIAKALELLHRGCGLHDGVSACMQLGVMYREGDGVAVDRDEARRWFAKVCAGRSTCDPQYYLDNDIR